MSVATSVASGSYRAGRWHTIFRFEAFLSVAIGLAVGLGWAMTGGGRFWPAWVWFGLAVPLGLQAAVRWGLRAPKGRRFLSLHVSLSFTVVVMLLLIWLLSGPGPFWPVWPAVSLGIVFAVHVWVARYRAEAREQALASRVDVLTRTRRGALDTQAVELRRIERDLHDGAQARLVSVAMSLGLAETLLETDPDLLAELLAEARSTTLAALDDLRTVMQGILPPVLADRGLEGAVRALALDVAVPVTVSGGLACRRRPGGIGRLLHRRRVPGQRDQAQQRDLGLGGPPAPGRRAVGCRGRQRMRRGQHRRRYRAARRHPAAGILRRDRRGQQPGRRPHDGHDGGAVRVVIAEDLALLRDGLSRLLRAHGFEVVAEVGDAAALAAVLAGQQVDVAIMDVRMPPTFTNEGLVAAIEARARRPGMPVVVLSQYVEQLYARELMLTGSDGVGYLLKDRVADVRTFVDAVRRVAAGGTVLDPKVVAALLSQHGQRGPMGRLTAREREVLGLMAEGRSNAGIAAKLFVTDKAIDKHIANIFTKLDLPMDHDDNRRVLAVLRYLQDTAPTS